jgi:hypothetical protein
MGGLFGVAIEEYARTFLQPLEARRQAWIAGDDSAVAGALKLCHAHRQPPPPWVVIGAAMMQPRPSPGDVRDWLRWHVVKRGTGKRLTKWRGGACFDWAAAQLCAYRGYRNTSRAAVRKSYFKVNEILRSGNGRHHYPTVVILEHPPLS